MGSIANKHELDKSPKRFLPSIATMSMGSPAHALDTKLKAAASKGFLGIELYWDDLHAYSFLLGNQVSDAGETAASRRRALLCAASEVAKLAETLGLRIISLQPFRNFDGLRNREVRRQRVDEFKLWLAVARELGTDTIGVPSTLPTVRGEDYTGDVEAAAEDLRQLCRLAKEEGIRVAYENLCFAAYVQDWEEAWERIRLAGEVGNLVFLPDTFNLCGRRYMDPEEESGRAAHASANLQASLERLVDVVPMSKMPILQVADAERLEVPLTEDHPWRKESGLVPLMALSRNARLFPFEKRGYLPILHVIQILAEAGWEGWVSMEVFTRTAAVPGERTIWEHADRAWRSWQKLADSMGWAVRPEM
ncbi:4-hydroxyphenylpyruvate dioxygenase [Pochonia chlamydosporia 170]|uniref:4-hydroxyphenylpyruvate dioxygenase n=1 Tax=Pochonia chlamydosporia 170 TaxID=1380566 RepID=A0A179FY54_METCM|nr:4-hydroxyphenylpyruvate dioxygenase [Pochonia chlamydosporia 170]OAQ70606.1 4-hydroxyphenylpyruvate dioxygenase [Pochonia chlamydosporia 170]